MEPNPSAAPRRIADVSGAPVIGASARRFAVVLTVFCLALLWGLLAYWAISSHRATLDATERSLRGVTRSVETQTRQLVGLAGGVLAATEQWLQDHPDADVRGDARLQRQFGAFRERAGAIVEIALADDRGGLFLPLPQAVPPIAGIGDSDYFRDAMSGEPGRIFIGAPLGGRKIPLLMRLAKPHGDTVALVALVDVELLVERFARERPPSTGAIALVRGDGLLLARAPHQERLIGQSLVNGPLYREHLPRADSGFVRLEHPLIDAFEKFAAYSLMRDFPLLVVVSVGSDEVLAGWRRQTLFVAMLAALASLIVVLAGWRLSAMLADLSRQAAELQHLASTDLMTGVHNRAHFLELLYREYARGMRYRTPLSLMVLDLDFFKQINDGYGHAAGDEALRAFSATTAACLRGMDILGRLGGEEFGIALPNTALEQAATVAERIRSAVARIEIETGYGVVRFTTSIGVTQSGDDEDSVEAFLARADAALYDAKVAGRNRVARRAQNDPGPFSLPPPRR